MDVPWEGSRWVVPREKPPNKKYRQSNHDTVVVVLQVSRPGLHVVQFAVSSHSA